MPARKDGKVTAPGQFEPVMFVHPNVVSELKASITENALRIDELVAELSRSMREREILAAALHKRKRSTRLEDQFCYNKALRVIVVHQESKPWEVYDFRSVYLSKVDEPDSRVPKVN